MRKRWKRRAGSLEKKMLAGLLGLALVLSLGACASSAGGWVWDL